MSGKSLRPLSLAQHFDAPEDYIGHFGWLCGYSADALFLDDAAERFTRYTHSQRAHQGRISLAALLDPGNPQISVTDVPGVAHLPIADAAKKPFRLLHAKVALLGFRHQENREWRLRLLVSTGNWTRQTLEESLDLIWRIDISSESLNKLNAHVRQDCADIKAAWNLLAWMQKLFDTRLLSASAHGETKGALSQVNAWINACSQKAKGEPRFFDNREKSLQSQLPEKIKADCRRNYLAMGSGFYETSNDQQGVPEVPTAIIKTLVDKGLLTKSSEKDIYVNPKACQSIATSLQALKDENITVRSAAIPSTIFGENAERSLHAKFLFSANFRKNSNTCTNPWVYLGSGNLTNPGFANKMSATAGNLEAGVVFSPDVLFWEEESKATQEHQLVTNLLPIHWDGEIFDVAELKAGPGMEQREAMYIAPPVAWLEWHEMDDICELRTDDNCIADFEVLDATGAACSKTENGFLWCEARPREVCIRWQADNRPHEGKIPVIDQYGRIAATELPAIDIDEAWWRLADFPMPPDDDGNEESDEFENEHLNSSTRQAAPIADYPIRQMMNLIESIAAKQTGIDEADWTLWCNRLEQTLGQAAASAPVQYFRDELKLNPLSPLRHPAFRPSFAENINSKSGKLYEESLSRIELKWKVNASTAIEGSM